MFGFVFLNMLVTVLIVWKCFEDARPVAVLTTGAAPGLLTILVAKFLFRNTIWIDSVANVKTMSGCGHVARYFAKHVYTQWPDLADDSVDYVGNIFGDPSEEQK